MLVDPGPSGPSKSNTGPLQTLHRSNGPRTSPPSLFLKQHSSYHSDSGEDTSDLSEDDDPEDLRHYASRTSLGQVLNDNSRRQRLPQQSGPCCSRYVELALITLTQLAQLAQLGPKITPPDSKKNIFFIENTPSPLARSLSNRANRTPSFSGSILGPQKEAQNAGSGIQNTQNQNQAPFKRQDSLFCSQNLPRASSDDLSSVSSSELSESDDEERDDLHELRARQPSTISKSSRSMKSDNESEWISISSEDERNQNSPTVLKPLTFAKVVPVPVPPLRAATTDAADLSAETIRPSPIAKPRSLLSGLFLNSMADQKRRSPNGENGDLNIAAPKPVLKRSSTTGVITIENNGAGSSSGSKEKKHLLRPSIMFSKRYASFSDISKLSQRSPVLFVEEEEASGDAANKDDSGLLFAKQTSSVGLLDFMVSGSSTTNLSKLNLNDDHVSKPHCESCELTISSSLSKYSNVHTHGGSSLKNLLSKSSLSLSSLFGQTKRESRPRPHGQREFSNESLKTKDSASDRSPISGSAAPLAKQEDFQKSPTPLSASADNHSKSIRTSHVPAKTFEPLVEVSGSLKDSLLIDHRLGKVPLPERIISDEDIFGGRDRLVFDQDDDDYHSKGW